jgi:uncharacterized protein YbjT (DUF2867 family)
MRIAVAGGTGVVGAQVVSRARERGHDVVVLSRATGVDVRAGTGLADRLAGVDAVVDCLNVKTNSRARATSFFTTTSRNLLAAEEAAGVSHHVLLSIVGIDRVGFAYYRAKVEQERVVEASGRPATILRATQFHEFGAQLLERTRVGPVALAPRMLAAPVAAGEVATALVDLAEGEPLADTVEIGGPDRIDVPTMIRRLLAARGSRLLVVPMSLPGGGAGARTGALTPDDPWRTGEQRYDDWLASGQPAG